ncbi:uncharacterized protein LOC9637789 [Selaginella moellendorffii]|nr:uncharacterized protein LOC9637789 [Selaginella moellendorffii]|eukprot:XP_024533970.1 uncharacterized protein LOC9637789 [Selaginella moellendorffii]
MRSSSGDSGSEGVPVHPFGFGSRGHAEHRPGYRWQPSSTRWWHRKWRSVIEVEGICWSIVHLAIAAHRSLASSSSGWRPSRSFLPPTPKEGNGDLVVRYNGRQHKHYIHYPRCQNCIANLHSHTDEAGNKKQGK